MKNAKYLPNLADPDSYRLGGNLNEVFDYCLVLNFNQTPRF